MDLLKMLFGAKLCKRSTVEYDCGGGVELKLKEIPAGSYMMGSESWSSTNRPVHKVTITEPFYMGIYPVTQAQYQAVMGQNPSCFSDKLDSPQRPVERVSWEDAKIFCRKLSQKTGQQIELPSEEKWEYACRAGTTGGYAGNLKKMGWYDENSRGMTHPVAKKRPNAWGMYDMHGNVWEWCADMWHHDYEGAPGDGTVWLNGDDENCSPMRGGSWIVSDKQCFSTSRARVGGSKKDNYQGFRVCLVNTQISLATVSSKGLRNESRGTSYLGTLIRCVSKGENYVSFLNRLFGPKCERCGEKLHVSVDAVYFGPIADDPLLKKAKRCPSCGKIFCGNCSIEVDMELGKPEDAVDFNCPFCRTTGIPG